MNVDKEYFVVLQYRFLYHDKKISQFTKAPVYLGVLPLWKLSTCGRCPHYGRCTFPYEKGTLDQMQGFDYSVVVFRHWR